jgi:XTP/dITP diphosphohydrolase
MQEGLLIIATRNQHKVGEISAILGEQFRLLSLDELPGAPEVLEDAPTFAGNATKKSVEIANWISLSGRFHRARATEHAWVLADDSGLEVDALSGAPGVHSARFAALDTGKAGNSSDAENREKMLRLLSGVPAEKRTARFRCVLALTPLAPREPELASPVCYADEAELQTRLFNGVCEGSIITVARGAGGFGYDSLFIPFGYEKTFGELPDDIKNRLSHRAQALAAMKAALLA